MSGIVFVGVATLDAVALVERYPEADDRVVATDVRFAGGGPAATAAVTAARLGLRVAFVGAVGADREGSEILAGLAAEGVDTSCVETCADARSAVSVVVADRPRQTRAIAARPGPPLRLAPGGRAAELILDADWVHVDHVGWSAVEGILAASGRRPRVSVDAGNPIDGLRLDGVDLYVPTVRALRARYGDRRDPFELLQEALREGAGAVVATDGAGGAIAADGGASFRVPAHPAAIVSTLGAGDVFHGALVAGMGRGLALEESAHLASRVAALSCRALDARSAVPTLDEVNPAWRVKAAPSPPAADSPPRPLDRLARRSGGYVMLALDQRESMRAMFAEHQREPVGDEQLSAFKLAATRILTPHASAVLLDREFALDRAIEERAVAPTCALIAAADRFIPANGELVGDVEVDDAVDPAHYRAAGAVAMKLLVIHRPDGDPARRVELVERFLERCHGAGLVSIIEPVSRKPLGGGPWSWDDGVLAAARELGSLGADLYKAEVPLHGQGDPDEVRRRCAAITEAVDGPWVVLSSGVPQDRFPAAVELACREGASGCLAGRAVWRACIGADDVERALREDAVPRLRRLAEIVDAVAGAR